jgi:uncharacterized protein (DUF2267 family)
MTATGLDVFDATVQQTNTWLNEIAQEMHWDDRHRAYLALRGTLHALRDYLVTDEAAHMAAQLPLLVRGIFYEGWDPAHKPDPNRGRDDFIGRVAGEFRRADPTVDPVSATQAVLRVLSRHISAGELDQARQSLPKDVRDVWPRAA